MQWNVALDIGTSTVRMALRGRGVAFTGSAAVAVRDGEQKDFAIGDEALEMYGRAFGRVRVGFPIENGQVGDEKLLRAWFNRLLREAVASGRVHRPRVLVAHPPAAGSAARKALVAYCMEAGAAACSLVRSDYAAAVGAGLDPMRPEAALVGEIGAGSMTVTLFSLGRVIGTRSLPYGARRVDQAIETLLRSEYALAVGPRTAEEIKLSCVSALGGSKLAVDVRGLDLNHSLPRTRKIEADILQGAIRPVIDDFCVLVNSVTRGIPAELSADLAEAGIALTGGGAGLFGLDKLVAEATGLSVRLPEDPAGCVARGLASALEKPAQFETVSEVGATLLKS